MEVLYCPLCRQRLIIRSETRAECLDCGEYDISGLTPLQGEPAGAQGQASDLPALQATKRRKVARDPRRAEPM